MKVLVTGASGLVGSQLTVVLQSHDYEVVHLSRTAKNLPVKTYSWDLNQGKIDPETIEGVDYIVHLAGAGVADSRWSAQRKKEILESRTESSQLLIDLMQSSTHQVKGIVAASAVGYYGMNSGDRLCDEETERGNDFLSDVVVKWEEKTAEFRGIGLPTAQLRIGIVLDRQGGAMAKIEQPTRLGFGAPLGSGSQWMSWIHVEDLCRMIVHALENGLDGVYNAVAPQPVTNADLTTGIARQLNKPLFMPNVPAFALRLMFGEMADMILGGNNVSSKKIEASGFQFNYPGLESALEALYTTG